MDTCETVTDCGRIRGLSFGDHREYRGIHYASANRWEYPQPAAAWEGTYDATRWGSCSYQRRSFEDDAVCNKFYHHEFREGMQFAYSEDCLFLNIWSPEKPNDCPVLIYIHGGSFTGGSSNEEHISGVEMAKNGVIFVSFNYRLGPFGFCSHPDLTNTDGICGNYGLYDQFAAIQWVKEHISSFGGNPQKITLMGQSAGAMSVDIHSSSTMEKGWFAGFMMSSGAALQRRILKPRMPEQTRHFWDAVCKNANVADMRALKEVDPKTLFYAWHDACKKEKGSMPCTLPVYDGKLLTRDAFTMRHMPSAPCIVGMTKNDMMPIVMEFCVKSWIKAAERSGSICYAYLLSHDLPGDNAGAWHSSDLLYFFSTLTQNWRPFTAADRKLSEQMSAALVSFTKTGCPNCDVLPRWEHGVKWPMTFCGDTRQTVWHTGTLLKNTIQKGKSE